MSRELTVVGASGTGRASEELSLTQFCAGSELQLQLTQAQAGTRGVHQFVTLTKEQALEMAEELVKWAEG